MTDAIELVNSSDPFVEWMDNFRFVQSCFKRFPCDWVTRNHQAVYLEGRTPLVFRAGRTSL
jgi:hypothetical protein